LATGAQAHRETAALDAAQVRASGAGAWRNRLEARFHRLDLAPDLAENIGSSRWMRGFGTLLALSFAALSFWPDFSTVEAAPARSADPATRDEFRSQMIMPLAHGGESGRRMGATARVGQLAAVPERPRLSLVATLGQDDSFARMLQRAGVGLEDAARVAALVGDQVPTGELNPGTRFEVVLGQRAAPGAPRSLESLKFRARFDLDLAISRRAGALVLVPQPLAVDTTPLRIAGTVGSSLYRSARAAGAPPRAIQQYLQTLDAHLGLDSDIAPTDRFDFVVAYKRSASGESEVGELVYAGLERAGKPLTQLVRFGPDGRFYDAAGGAGAQRVAFFAPVQGRITSGFGMRRHPILGYSRLHAGLDFGAPWGAPIFAVSDGVVSFAGRRGGHGNYVRLEHGGGLGTGYGHMSRIAVSPGTQVRGGQVIGYVGSTGLSTGPHLHYEVYKAGHTVDPLSVRFAAAAAVDPGQAAALKARLAQLKSVAPGAALKSLAVKQAIAK
jgi:murein DD-endopeptidase MepM/ murein hydrolase activator NlpD